MSGKVKETQTLIVVILDESGSMQSQKNDVLGGFNSFVSTQLEEAATDQGRLVLVKFSDCVKIGHSARPLSEVPQLDASNYRPSGSTALYDAVSEGIRIAEGAMQKEERVLVLIMTDGEENSSKKATADSAKELIRSHEALGNWTFVYIGKNPESWAKATGQSASNARPYDLNNQRENFNMASAATSDFRSSGARQRPQGYFN